MNFLEVSWLEVHEGHLMSRLKDFESCHSEGIHSYSAGTVYPMNCLSN